MKVELLPHVLSDSEQHLMIFRPRGIINAELISRAIEMLEEIEDQGREPFHRFTDLSKPDAVDVDFHDLFRVFLHRRLAYKPQSPVKSVFYVTSPATARIVKVHAVLTKTFAITRQNV